MWYLRIVVVRINVYLSEPSPGSIMATRPSIIIDEWDNYSSFPHLIYDTLEVRPIRE